MKNYWIFFLIWIFLNNHMLAAESKFEFRFSPFFHSSKLFREIYGDVGGVFQAQASTQLSNHFEVWSNVDWFSKKGHSIGLHELTNVSISNCSLGVNFVYEFNNLYSFYLGLGPSFGTIWIHNKSSVIKTHEHKTAVGAVTKAGIYLKITDSLYFNLFLDYLYQPIKFENHVNIGGFKPGVGIGLIF